MKNSLLSFCFFLLCTVLIAQSKTKWQAGFEAQKVFIENKSQFNGADKLRNSEILFATDEGPVMIYFTKNGVTYRFDKVEREMKNEEEEQETKRKSHAERE